MLRQYFELKKQVPDAILFFRMGDFYEMFFDDARTAAPILEVVLTSRDKNKENAVPLCGVPYHAMESYAAKLLRKGHKVAVCEQVEDPALAKGVVRREITHILTPSTALEIEGLDGPAGSFVVAASADDRHLALASADIGAGEFTVRAFAAADRDAFAHELYRRFPREALVARSLADEFAQQVKRFPELDGMLVSVLDDNEFHPLAGAETLKRHFGLETISGLGLDGYPAATGAAAALLGYLRGVRRRSPAHIASLRFEPNTEHLLLDPIAFRNLEIVANLRTGTAAGSLLEAVDFTVTGPGRRLLKEWLSAPLLDAAAIERRLDAVEELSADLIVRSEVRRSLKGCADLARLNARIALAIATPPQLQALAATLELLPALQGHLQPLRAGALAEIAAGLDPLPGVSQHVRRAIADDPGNVPGDGSVVRPGYSPELDELRALRRSAREVIAALERRERERTGIPSLKVRYNRVFGYFIEVTHAHRDRVPEDYQRKQTLVNAERFLTPELKELEDRILRAEEQIGSLEKRLYEELLSAVQRQAAALSRNAEQLARLDVLGAGGELAQRRSYCRPRIDDSGQLRVQEGRHPVVEAAMGRGFIPNDLQMAGNDEQLLLITGPNMGGKSTFLRQNALIVVLAQSGYFVPASAAHIGLVDRIFTRIGASDSLLEGKSTFLVEMIETAVILNNATPRSLILLDEIGRGTSTFDGLSIAWAVVEYLHGRRERPKTLFATHYHELTELGGILERVRNLHIAVREWQEQVVFLHKVQPGPTDQSFGIHVAKIAGIPRPVIERAKEILLNLEKKELNRLVTERITGQIPRVPAAAPTLFAADQGWQAWDRIRRRLAQLDISGLTPLEALNVLAELKESSEQLE